MRAFSVLASWLSISSLLLFVAANADVEVEVETEDSPQEPFINIPEVEEVDDGVELFVAAAWPESNPFGHVVNGEKNVINVLFEAKVDKNITLVNIAGSINQPDSQAVLRNLSAATYNIPLIKGAKFQLPYTFYSEFKPGDLLLNIWAEHIVDGEQSRTYAYESIITVVEPEASLLDFKLVSTYLIVSAALGGLLYFAYLSFFPQTKKSRSRPNPSSVSAPVGSVTATGAGGYQEEWIPEHHLRKTKSGKKKAGATSGDELSGGETSGTEGVKKRK